MATSSTPVQTGNAGARPEVSLLRDCLAGVVAALPVVLGYIPIGLAFGVGAAEKGIGPAAVGLMSLFVFAGASQFVAVNMLAAGATAGAIVSTTFLVNLRHLLMSAALGSHVRGWPTRRLLAAAFWLTDESFAVLSSGLATGRLESPLRPAFVLSLQASAYISWVGSTFLGALLYNLVTNGGAFDVRGFGFDLTLPAMFAGLLALQLRQRSARQAAVVAALVTSLTLQLGVDSWARTRPELVTLISALAGAVWAGARTGPETGTGTAPGTDKPGGERSA